MYRAHHPNQKMPQIEYLDDAETESERQIIPVPKRTKRKRDEESDDGTVATRNDKVTLESIRRQNEGIFSEKRCMVCKAMMGADVEIDDTNWAAWNQTYYDLRGYISPKEMYEFLTSQYNNTLADGEEITALEVRNHFEQNHLLDSEWSINETIRNLETMEQRLSQHCFTTDSFDPKAIDSYLKVATTKHMMYNTKRKRLVG